MKIEMIPVESSTIKAIGWSDMKLRVTFTKNSNYEYENVPEKLFLLLKKANEVNQNNIDNEKGHIPGPNSTISLGTLFHYLVKIHADKYPYKKLNPSEL